MSDIYDLKEAASNAVSVAPIVSDFVGEATQDIVSKCTSLYNSGRLTPEAALAAWAQIAALDKLMSEIINKISRAERAEAKERQRAEGREN